MYYWTKNSKDQKLEQELYNFGGAHSIFIASAFVSNEGIEILKNIANKYSLTKKEIKLYISDEFSSSNPAALLEELTKICDTNIVFERNFHAKVYLLNGTDKAKIIYGSSNLTSGGFNNNIEFDYIGEASNESLINVQRFFEFCKTISTPVDQNIIAYYKKYHHELEKLKGSQKRIKSILKGYKRQTDDFLEDEYDLQDFYFDYQDYETFFIRNRGLDNIAIREKRKEVQEKMLMIHKKVYPQIKKMGVECHWRDENITSLIRPCIYNKGMVAWNGVRYGKTKSEIDKLNFNGEKDDIFGFQKHGCLQYCIVSRGFEINLYLAVKHDAVDRAYLFENLKKLRGQIENELRNLKRYNMQWVIYDELIDKEYVYDIDSESPKSFFQYFRDNDDDGKESFLRLFYEPDDIRIKSLECICGEVIEKFKLLLPLYNTMVYRP